MSMFSQRHYEAVARTLKVTRVSLIVTATVDTQALWDYTVQRFSEMFQADNPNFKPHIFQQRCRE
jgi:hypothetical protein